LPLKPLEVRMQTLRLSLKPCSAFGTPLKGDTLFGQLCWAIRNRFGEARLIKLLQDYTAGRPFAVISDAFPGGHLPRPMLPGHVFDEARGIDRKAARKRIWLPLECFPYPIATWSNHCQSAQELPAGVVTPHPQPHNSINRATGTTGAGFDPYTMNQLWFAGEADTAPILDVYLLLDETRLTGADLQAAFTDMSALGFGRDASIGLGKFEIIEIMDFELPVQANANAWLTLAPCAPQGLGWEEARCFYQPFTRFGRHGDLGVHLGNPFKTPVLLAGTGAVLTPPTYGRQLFTGQGLGGDGCLSKAIPETVHQGYAPVVGIALPKMEQKESAA
jgi:CRISPR-associated protein Csm4